MCPEERLFLEILYTFFQDVDYLSRLNNNNDFYFNKKSKLTKRRGNIPRVGIRTLLSELHSSQTKFYCDLGNVNFEKFKLRVINYLYLRLKIKVHPLTSVSVDHLLTDFELTQNDQRV